MPSDSLGRSRTGRNLLHLESFPSTRLPLVPAGPGQLPPTCQWPLAAANTSQFQRRRGLGCKIYSAENAGSGTGRGHQAAVGIIELSILVLLQPLKFPRKRRKKGLKSHCGAGAGVACSISHQEFRDTPTPLDHEPPSQTFHLDTSSILGPKWALAAPSAPGSSPWILHSQVPSRG